ncbi:sulfotransferase domain-containing protein [Pseudotabrizicola algicola]|uniref:Sulfotransferase domain-containing protein n=1 Tax=Pseudotabrizicola algicola TaxID=2709381 RepID=A0A6B3RKN3_9RHOB|nr:sulfotransferase domain-containing protein [Pseudotabrizicola algicola]NEX46594.1 hypothetical protein [Pseudotabrizicola algicola]
MAKLFLHIGAHKTATSYLQALFFHNRKILADAGLHYPNIGPNNAHHALAASWLTMHDLPSGFFDTSGPDGFWERTILQPYAHHPGTVFLSAENFSRFHPQRVNMVALSRRLAAFDEVKVIYTLRAQTDMISSLWTQVARTRRAPSLRAYMERVFTRSLGGGVPLDHHAVYHHLLKGFGPEQIILLDYDDIRRRPGGVGQVFLDLLGTGLSVTDLATPPPDEHNVSPDPLAMWLACQISRDKPPPAQLIDLVTAALHPQGPRPTTLLNKREHDRVRSKFRDGNARLVEAVGPFQPEFRFDPPPAPENVLYRDQIAQHVWPDIAAALWTERAPGQIRGILGRVLNRLLDQGRS